MDDAGKTRTDAASAIQKAETRFALLGAVIAMAWNAVFFILWMNHAYSLEMVPLPIGFLLSTPLVGLLGYFSGRTILRKIDRGGTAETAGITRGALCGAGVGAVNGSFIVPLIGTIIGAVLGIFIGAFSGWIAALIAEWMVNRAKRG